MKSAPHSKPEALTVAVGEFKAKCLGLIAEANETQRKIGVTKRGKLVGHFVPVSTDPKPFRSIFGRTPAIKMPSHEEWKKMKEEWADEWEQSTERLARQIHGDFSEKR